MRDVSAVVKFAQIGFGVLAGVAGVLLLTDIFLFTAAGAASNIWVWNLAAAPLVYLAVYVWSVFPARGTNGQPPSTTARLFRAFTPAFGVAWYFVAWIAIDQICHGNLAC